MDEATKKKLQTALIGSLKEVKEENLIQLVAKP